MLDEIRQQKQPDLHRSTCHTSGCLQVKLCVQIERDGRWVPASLTLCLVALSAGCLAVAAAFTGLLSHCTRGFTAPVVINRCSVRDPPRKPNPPSAAQAAGYCPRKRKCTGVRNEVACLMTPQTLANFIPNWTRWHCFFSKLITSWRQQPIKQNCTVCNLCYSSWFTEMKRLM